MRLFLFCLCLDGVYPLYKVVESARLPYHQQYSADKRGTQPYKCASVAERIVDGGTAHFFSCIVLFEEFSEPAVRCRIYLSGSRYAFPEFHKLVRLYKANHSEALAVLCAEIRILRQCADALSREAYRTPCGDRTDMRFLVVTRGHIAHNRLIFHERLIGIGVLYSELTANLCEISRIASAVVSEKRVRAEHRRGPFTAGNAYLLQFQRSKLSVQNAAFRVLRGLAPANGHNAAGESFRNVTQVFSLSGNSSAEHLSGTDTRLGVKSAVISGAVMIYRLGLNFDFRPGGEISAFQRLQYPDVIFADCKKILINSPMFS